MLKKLAYTAAAFLMVATVMFALGPRPVVDDTIEPVSLPKDLDTYLSESEAAYDDLISNTEKTIIWADSTRRMTPLSIVYLHGFSATRQETHPLSDSLARSLGANLFYTRLRGHGRDGDAMGEVTVNDWMQDAVEALEIGRRLGERVIVIGVSTGGTLATWLMTQENAGDILATVLVSPNFLPQDPGAGLLLWPWGETIATWTFGAYRSWEPSNELHGRYWTNRYPIRAVTTMMAMVQTVEELDLSRIKTPVLVVYSTQDRVVRPEKTEERFSAFGSEYKQLVPFESAEDPSNHVIAGNILSPGATGSMHRIILDFLEPLIVP